MEVYAVLLQNTHNYYQMFETLIKTCLKYDVSAVFIPELKEVHISSDAGRFIRPVLNLQTIKTNGDVMWNSFQNCLENGHVVYKMHMNRTISNCYQSTRSK